jgi:hypothetical protein
MRYFPVPQSFPALPHRLSRPSFLAYDQHSARIRVSAERWLAAFGKKTIGATTESVLKKRVREKSQRVDTVAYSPEGPEVRSGRQSEDLQGLSSVEGADSESVGELLEEGNAFEADAVMGVEDAGNADEKEVGTHEVS